MVQPWTFSGYQGFRTRGLQWGERPDSTIVRLSSDEARWNWWEFYELSENVTRVDWQVTHRTALSPFKRVLAHHRQARKYWRKRRDGPTITMITDDRQGATLYLGKRSSRLLLRCYNKHAESMDQRYEGCVRYEVEMKGELGKFMMLKLSSGIDPLPGIISQVHQMFHERGVVPEFAKEVLPFACEWSRKATDVDRKRQWLRNQVQPTVSFLIGHFGMAAVAEDLGLSEFASASHNYYQPWTRRSNNEEVR
jgi:DNA relaxase NicK